MIFLESAQIDTLRLFVGHGRIIALNTKGLVAICNIGKFVLKQLRRNHQCDKIQ